MELVIKVFYRVQEGDTLLGIARLFNMKLGKLISMNTDFMEGGTRDMDKLIIGELICIKWSA
jgi:hypothetical protein